MEDCCKPIVSDRHQKTCPSCGSAGRSVKSLTVSVMVKDPGIYLRPESLPGTGFFFCETTTCPVVYFNLQNNMLIKKSDMRLKVWQKERDQDDVPACYCFNNSISSIRREIAEFGNTDVLSRIGAEVKEGNCRCEVTNPQGSCCLGNVAKAVKLAQERVMYKNALYNTIINTKLGKLQNPVV